MEQKETKFAALKNNGDGGVVVVQKCCDCCLEASPPMSNSAAAGAVLLRRQFRSRRRWSAEDHAVRSVSSLDEFRRDTESERNLRSGFKHKCLNTNKGDCAAQPHSSVD